VDDRIPADIATITVQLYPPLPQQSDPEYLAPGELDPANTAADPAATGTNPAVAVLANLGTTAMTPAAATNAPISVSMRKAVSTARSATGPSRHNYIVEFTFLDRSDLFQATFSTGPTLFTCPTGQAFSSASTQTSALDGFASQLRPLVWAVFKLLVWRNYIGHDVPESLQTHEIQVALSNIRSVHHISGQKKYRSPNDMYLTYQAPIGLLDSSDATVANWGFTLPHMFYHGLSHTILAELNSSTNTNRSRR
jgi:hypothetical protein